MSQPTIYKPSSIYAMDYMPISEHIDSETNALSLKWLFEYLYNTSTNHASEIFMYYKAIGMDVFPSNSTWVVTANEMKIMRYPTKNEVIRIETQILKFRSFFIERLYEVFVDEELVAEARVQFVLINITDRKVTRLNASILSAHGYEAPERFRRYERLMVPRDISPNISVNYEIQSHDIDFNAHVNNYSYIQWAKQQFEKQLIEDKILTGIKVKYNKEMFHDQLAEINTYIIENEPQKLKSFHEIINKSTEQEACLIELTFIRKDI